MIPFSKINNWGDFPQLEYLFSWRKISAPDDDIVFTSEYEGFRLGVRLNDFPEEPLYSLLVDGNVVIHFDDWPDFWGPQPEY